MNSGRAEAERLLAIGEKLLQSRDLNGSRDFAILAQEAEPLLEGSDQILAIVDVLLAAEKPVTNDQFDWYAILQLDRTCQDPDLIRKQYRRLGLLLHPDKNPFSLADHAFKLVSDAWAILSDPVQKPIYDRNITALAQPASFWTACPYCYFLFEYPMDCEGCCLRCQNCDKSFHGLSIPSLPPLVPGQEAYYCNWGSLPMGFVFGKLRSDGPGPGPVVENGSNPNVISNGVASELGSTPRKRGRPRKVV